MPYNLLYSEQETIEYVKLTGKIPWGIMSRDPLLMFYVRFWEAWVIATYSPVRLLPPPKRTEYPQA